MKLEVRVWICIFVRPGVRNYFSRVLSWQRLIGYQLGQLLEQVRGTASVARNPLASLAYKQAANFQLPRKTTNDRLTLTL